MRSAGVRRSHEIKGAMSALCHEPSFGEYRPPAWDAQRIDTFQGGPEDRPAGMLIHGERMVPAGLSRSSLSAASRIRSDRASLRWSPAGVRPPRSAPRWGWLRMGVSGENSFARTTSREYRARLSSPLNA
jgi:hypothetical protein